MYTTLKEVLKEAEDLNMAIGAFNTHNCYHQLLRQQLIREHP